MVAISVSHEGQKHETCVRCRGTKPFPPEKGQVAEVPLYAALFKDELMLYQDMSGESLHKRGYRTAMHTSSLNESAAAGLLSLADWPATASSGEQHILMLSKSTQVTIGRMQSKTAKLSKKGSYGQNTCQSGLEAAYVASLCLSGRPLQTHVTLLLPGPPLCPQAAPLLLKPSTNVTFGDAAAVGSSCLH